MRQSSQLLSQESKIELKTKKNLLAFSAGVDSTALFFLLVDENIEFDIAIVDYGMRDSSKDEVNYAKTLAKKYNKKIYIHRCKIKSGNFEKSARDERYQFFTKIIKEFDYQNLITAHQLNDKLEWFLMQLGKGAGLVEILGFEEVEERESYRLVRPLINSTKDELLEYLNSKNIKYFIDESNYDLSLKRNFIRKNISNLLIDEYKDGIKRSFTYLHKDKDELFKYQPIKFKDLIIVKNDSQFIRSVDLALKRVGYLLSSSQRDEIEKQKDIVIADRFVVAFNSRYIYICPNTKISMPKTFKEQCRVLKIPDKIRAYLFSKEIDPNSLPL